MPRQNRTQCHSCGQLDSPPPNPQKINTLDALTETRKKHAGPAFSSIWKENTPNLIGYGIKYDKVFGLTRTQIGKYDDWYLLGDIHGDYYALRNAVNYIEKQNPDFRLIFLGDLVDRGPHPMECLWYLLFLAQQYPNRIMWLAGNHDIGISYHKDSDDFRSDVEPSEFLNHLNLIDSWAFVKRNFGKEFIELTEGLPRAVIFPDGLLVTHGGCPHPNELPNRQKYRSTMDWLICPAALEDFTYSRISNAKKKMHNSTSRDGQYGYEDFELFCRAVNDTFTVTRLVTGHEHPIAGFDEHKTWVQNRALTLTGFGFAPDYENPEAFNTRYRDYLVVGRCRENDIPEVIQIPVDREDLKRYFDGVINPWFNKNRMS